MQIRYKNREPAIDELAYIAPTAVVRGDVRIGAGSAVLFGAVISAEGGHVEIGADCVVMENAVIRGTPKHPAVIGDRVLVGPHAHLSGCNVERDSFLATGSNVFNGAVIEHGSEVRVNGTVHVNTRLKEGSTVPIGWIAVGDPAQCLPPSEHDKIWEILRELNFPDTVWSVPREVSQGKRTKLFARALARHNDDSVINDEQ